MNLKLIPALLLATQLHAENLDLGTDRSSYSEGFAIAPPATNQHVSLDLFFNKDVHVFQGTYNFSVGLAFLCTVPDFMTGTVELLDANGGSLGVFVLGAATSSNGFMFSAGFPTTTPLDFSGVHFELNVPDVTILSGDFFMSSLDFIYRGRRTDPFRIGPSHIPETGTTFGLLFLALLTLVLFRDKKTIS